MPHLAFVLNQYSEQIENPVVLNSNFFIYLLYLAGISDLIFLFKTVHFTEFNLIANLLWDITCHEHR